MKHVSQGSQTAAWHTSSFFQNSLAWSAAHIKVLNSQPIKMVAASRDAQVICSVVAQHPNRHEDWLRDLVLFQAIGRWSLSADIQRSSDGLTKTWSDEAKLDNVVVLLFIIALFLSWFCVQSHRLICW